MVNKLFESLTEVGKAPAILKFYFYFFIRICILHASSFIWTADGMSNDVYFLKHKVNPSPTLRNEILIR